MSPHFSTEQLAEAQAHLLTPDLAAEVDAHVAECAECADVLAALSALPELLAAEQPTMPPAVAERLRAAVAAEVERRETGEAAAEAARKQAEHAKRLTTGTFGENVPTKRHTGIPEVDGSLPRHHADL